MIRLLLIRHGQTTWSAESRYQGQTDIPLNDTGLRQAEAVGRHFTGRRIDALYSSDLGRAMRTAAPIGAATSMPVIADVRLREAYFGQWEGLTLVEIHKRWPDALTAWQANPTDHTPPGGESLAQVTQRISLFMHDVKHKHRRQTVAVVCHGGAVRAFVCHLLDLPPHVFWRMTIGPCSLTEVRIYEDDRAVLSLLNDEHIVEDIV